jgi:hypothetical protein
VWFNLVLVSCCVPYCDMMSVSFFSSISCGIYVLFLFCFLQKILSLIFNIVVAIVPDQSTMHCFVGSSKVLNYYYRCGSIVFYICQSLSILFFNSIALFNSCYVFVSFYLSYLIPRSLFVTRVVFDDY